MDSFAQKRCSELECLAFDCSFEPDRWPMICFEALEASVLLNVLGFSQIPIRSKFLSSRFDYLWHMLLLAQSCIFFGEQELSLGPGRCSRFLCPCLESV